MAKKRKTARPRVHAATIAALDRTDTAEFINDLTLLFARYNGRLYKIKESATIAAVAQLASGFILAILSMRK